MYGVSFGYDFQFCKNNTMEIFFHDLMDTKSMIIYHTVINDFTVSVFP